MRALVIQIPLVFVVVQVGRKQATILGLLWRADSLHVAAGGGGAGKNYGGERLDGGRNCYRSLRRRGSTQRESAG
jgi:hypothetical protein